MWRDRPRSVARCSSIANRNCSSIVVTRGGLLCGGWESSGVPGEFMSTGIFEDS